jgi:hypothetical protein
MPRKRRPETSAASGEDAANVAVVSSAQNVVAPTIIDASGGAAIPSETKDYTDLAPEGMAVIVPNEEVKYLIDDHQLELISAGWRKNSFEWLGYILGCFGFSQNVFSVISSQVNGKPSSAIDMVCSAIFIIFVVVGYMKWGEHHNDGGRIEKIKQQIRTGRRVGLKQTWKGISD